MKNVISKIFSEEIDEEVHSDFVKYGRGVFENKYLLEGKKQTDKWSIKSSSEFVNYFVKKGLEKTQGKVKISGAIISTLDLTKEIDFQIEDTKGYIGIKQVILDSEIESSKILNLMKKYPRVFFALSFPLPDYELKIKAKTPKNGKPSNKGDEQPRADFCSLKTTDEEMVKDLFFDFPDFREIVIKHTLEIKEIEIPKGEKDPVRMRENAKRKGIVKRIVNVDGKQEIRERNFVA